MDGWRSFGITARIALLTGIVVFGTAISVGAVLHARMYRLLQQQQSENLRLAADSAAFRLRTMFADLRQEVQVLGGVPAMRGLLQATRSGDLHPEARPAWHERLAALFAETLARHPHYRSIRYISITDVGRELLRVERRARQITEVPASELVRLAEAPYVAAALRLSIYQVYLSDLNAGHPVYAAYPVFTSDGALFGVLAIETEQIDSFLLTELVDDLSGIQIELTGRFGEPLFPVEEIPTPGPTAQPWQQTHEAGDSGAAGEMQQLREVHFDPEHPERSLGIRLTTEPPKWFHASLGILFDTLLLALIMAGSAVLLAVWLARRVTLPVAELTHAARQVATGDFRVNLPLGARHEVGVLASAFRLMLDQISARGLALEAKAAELTRLNGELEEFVYVVSHDLKAPLRAVSNISSWLEEDLGERVDDQSRERLHLLRSRVRRMDQFIDALLTFSRAGRSLAQPERVDLRELLREVVATLDLPPEFSVELPSKTPTLDTDRFHLTQVFSNLIGNALKHHDRRNGVIRIGWRPIPGGLYEFSVADDGPGIAPEYHERVFRVFQTLAARDERESTGIGLSIVRKVVESCGGRVWVESAPERGTVFKFTWPRRMVALHEPL